MRGRFAPSWGLVVLAILAHAWAAALGEGLRPPIEAESQLEHLVASDATFVIDFTWSEAHGLKVLEFGGSHKGGSSFRGHGQAHPDAPSVDELYELARKDYLRRSGRTPIPYEPLSWLLPWRKSGPREDGEGQAIVQPAPGRPYSRRLRNLYPKAAFLGAQPLNRTLMNKGKSQLLYGHPAPTVQPETYVTNLTRALKPEVSRELV